MIKITRGNELDCAIGAAKAAADILRPAFHAGYEERHDVQAEQCIQDILLRAFPRYGYLGEELGRAGEERDTDHRLWVVDPHDGTEAAKLGFRGAAISIALLQDGPPVLGVVFAYAAPDDNGDFFWWTTGMKGAWRNGKKFVATGRQRRGRSTRLSRPSMPIRNR